MGRALAEMSGQVLAGHDNLGVVHPQRLLLEPLRSTSLHIEWNGLLAAEVLLKAESPTLVKRYVCSCSDPFSRSTEQLVVHEYPYACALLACGCPSLEVNWLWNSIKKSKHSYCKMIMTVHNSFLIEVRIGM